MDKLCFSNKIFITVLFLSSLKSALFFTPTDRFPCYSNVVNTWVKSDDQTMVLTKLWHRLKPHRALLLKFFGYKADKQTTDVVLEFTKVIIWCYISKNWNIKLYQLPLIMNGLETDAFRFELPLLKLYFTKFYRNKGLHQCWWRILETKCVGDWFRILVTDLIREKITNLTKKVVNVMILPLTSEISHHHKVTNKMMSPT